MDESELEDKLADLGLTSYEASAYVSAVSLGAASPNELAEQSGVPRGRIYDVVDDLREMGLVEVRERSGSKEIQAPPPQETLEQFRERHVRRFSDRIHAVADSLDQFHEYERSSEGFVTMVSLRESALRHIRLAIDDAEYWLTMGLPVDLYERVTGEVAAAVDRGVTVRLVIDGQEAMDADPRPGTMGPTLLDGVAVRHRPNVDTFAFADRTYGIFNSTHPQEESQPYIVTQERNLVMLFQNYAEQIWSGSETIESHDGFPRRYLDPWRVIVDLGDRLFADETLVADVTGRETHSRRPDTWTGEVVDAEMGGPIETDFSAVIPTNAELTLDTGAETVTIGGWKATLEDVAADGIVVRED